MGVGVWQGLVFGGSWVVWFQGKIGVRIYVSLVGVQGVVVFGSGVRFLGMFLMVGGGLVELEEICLWVFMRYLYEEVELFEDCCKVCQV